jgi:hypothetical protein
MNDSQACPHCHGFDASTEECEHANWKWQGWDVSIPTNAVWHAINKARQLYIAVAAQQGRDPGPETESWSEFEVLRQYAETEARIREGMTDLRGL